MSLIKPPEQIIFEKDKAVETCFIVFFVAFRLYQVVSTISCDSVILCGTGMLNLSICISKQMAFLDCLPQCCQLFGLVYVFVIIILP